MRGAATLLFYAAVDGQRFWLQYAVTHQLVEDGWEDVAPYLRIELAARAAGHGVDFPAEPSVLCWTADDGERVSATQPRVWPAWGSKFAIEDIGLATEFPLWSELPNARLLILEHETALAAARAWVLHDPDWWKHWHPTARWRDAAREVGVVAKLIDGPAGGEVRRLDMSMGPTIRYVIHQSTLGFGYDEAVYRRDPEPLGLTPQGEALWGYRYEGTDVHAPTPMGH